MAILKIAKIDHPVLVKKTNEIKDLVSLNLKKVVIDMSETMLDANGIGLAAPQVHLSYRMFIYRNPDIENDEKIKITALINPVIKKITNETEYGLGNYLQTEDKEKAKRVAKKLRSGVVYINGNTADAGTPFGGYRQSGNGREGGVWGLEEYLEVKTVTGWK